MSACRRGIALLVALVCFAAVANAQSTTFIFDLDAAQVAGGTSTSTSYGRGFATLDSSNVFTVTIFHDVVNPSFMTMDFGAVGATGANYNFFTTTASPAQLSFTLFSAADATTILNDGAFVQIYDAASQPVIRGQITNKFTSQVFISEWCHDPVPPAQSVGIDTNLDGIPATSNFQGDDEFIEFVNGSDQSVMLDNWTITDGFGLRHTFPAGTTLLPGESIVVFGGGDLTNYIGQGLLAQTASTFSLGLNNSGDTITLFDAGGNMIDTVTWIGGTLGDTDGESTTLVPAIPGGAQTPTTMLLNNLTHTPGFRDGGDFPWSTQALPGPAYAGNGTDAKIVVGINGSLSVTPTNIHDVNGGDVVQLTFTTDQSNLLMGTPFLSVLQPFATGNPAPPSAFPGDLVPTIRYSAGLPTIVIADGLSAPWLPLSPVLGFYTASGIIPPQYTGTNNSFMILLITFDPGINMLDLGNAEAQELRVL